jgi:hypothetical protein
MLDHFAAVSKLPIDHAFVPVHPEAFNRKSLNTIIHTSVETEVSFSLHKLHSCLHRVILCTAEHAAGVTKASDRDPKKWIILTEGPTLALLNFLDCVGLKEVYPQLYKGR